MARKAKELGPLEVKRLTKPGLHAVGGVAGLNLQVSDAGSKSWLLRYCLGGKRRALGLGGFPDVPLARAREAAREARAKLEMGNDPIDEKRAVRSALIANTAKALNFRECAEIYMEKHGPRFRSAKHRDQWPATMTAYAYPEIGKLIVSDIDHIHIIKILQPMWDERKFETARRVRGRIEQILNWATVMGYRKGDNPARWHGFLSEVFSKPHDARVKHHAALPLSDVPSFMRQLRKVEGQGARALEFAILTAARSGEVRNAVWSEIDLESALWNIPGSRMKAGKDHTVPLSSAALKLLRELPRAASNVVFAAPRGGPLSDMTLAAVIRRLHDNETGAGRAGYVDPKQGRIATPHGVARSSFRDWAAEHTNHPREVAEMALAHSIGSQVEAAYRRGNLIEKRRPLMADWAEFCTQEAMVIPMVRKVASV